jgi:hypothetical protein
LGLIYSCIFYWKLTEPKRRFLGERNSSETKIYK